MKKRLFWMATIVLLLIGITACSSDDELKPETPPPASERIAATVEPTPEPVPTMVKEPGSKGFLWKITGAGNSGYLAGTIHVAKEEMYPLDPDLEQAIADSDFFALELDVTKVSQIQVLKLINETALLKDGTTLQDYVSPEDYAKFGQEMKKSMGFAAVVFDKYEPWYAAMTLEALAATKYMKNDGIDKYIAKKAHKEGKTVLELESMEEQIGLFDGFSEELQQLYFHQTIENIDEAGEGLDQLLDLWAAGDLQQLKQSHADYMKEGKKSMGKLFQEFDSSFLVRRNQEMAKKVDAYLSDGDKGTYMFAVGALHMVGKQGLVSLLEKKGYKVEFIN